MSKNKEVVETDVIDQGVRSEPLYIKGGVEGEPEKFLGIKPFELDKYQYGLLRKNFDNKSIWFQSAIGATAGFVILVIAKLIQFSILTTPKDFNIEPYEYIVIIISLLITYNLREPKTSEEEKEKNELLEDIRQWFKENPARSIHAKHNPRRKR